MLNLFGAGYQSIISLKLSLAVISEFEHSAYYIGVSKTHCLGKSHKSRDTLAAQAGIA
jgi:hypothetical protein